MRIEISLFQIINFENSQLPHHQIWNKEKKIIKEKHNEMVCS